MKNLVSLLLLAIFSLPAFSQSITIFDIDTTNFPTMKAKFYAFDKDGNIQRPSANELTLKENGIVRTIKSVNCPVKKTPVAISSVLVMDISGSMSGKNINLAKIAAKKWINNLNMNISECAITSFDDANYLNQDFTNGRTRLLNAIESLQPMSGTSYDAALMHQLAGGLIVTKRAKYKKIIILLSDGMPTSEPNTYQIIAEANKQNCIIFCVSLGMKAPTSMKEMSKQTSGEYFEEITNEREIEKVYSTILQRATELNSCSIEWESKPECYYKDIHLEIQWNNETFTYRYYPSFYSVADLKIIPNHISFKKIAPQTQKDTVIELFAVNSDYNIFDIKIKNNTKIYLINEKYPIFIPKNTKKQITVSYLSQDSSLSYTSFDIISDICPTSFSANGGYSNNNIKASTLKLTKPNGGEEFVVGSDTMITWEGISQNDTVDLEFSIDSGRTWKILTKTATKFNNNWINIPKPTSNKCLVRVKQNKDLGEDTLKAKLLLNLIRKDNSLSLYEWSPNGNKIAISYYDNSIVVWNAITGDSLFSLQGDVLGQTPLISWSPDEQYILCYLNNFLLVINADSGLIKYKISEVGFEPKQIHWSPDGSMFSSTDEDKQYIIWSINDGSIVSRTNLINSRHLSLSWNPNSKIIAISTFDGGVMLLEAKTRKIIYKVPNTSYLNYDFSWSHNGKYLCVSSNETYGDSNVYIINIENGQIAKQLNFENKRVWKLSWSFDDNFIAGLSANKIVIWDVQSSKVIKTLNNSTYFHTVNWSPSELLLASTGYNQNANIWDFLSDKILFSFSTNILYVSGCKWDNTGKRVATIDYTDSLFDILRICKVWDLEFPTILQSDISDSVFSIVAPTPLGRDVDMKECLVAAVKDSVVSDFMQNVGSYRFRTDSIYFSGADPSAFQLVSGIPRYELEPGKTKFAELRFMPKRVGNHTAKINIIAGGDTLIYNITGIGVQPMLQVVNNIIDFGKIKVGASKDSIQANTIKNTGNGPITITKTLHAGPNDVDFTTLSGAAPFTFQPGETAKMNLRFNAKSRGRTSGQLKFEYNGVGSPAVVQLFAEGLPADTNCEGRSFVFRNFNLTSQVVKNGNSFITTDSTVRLTESKSNEVGGISYSEKVSLLSSFVMKFSFRFSNGVNSFLDGSLPGADGLAVLFQNGKGFRTTANGGSLGYNGIINCVALEMDMYRNSDFNDPNGNHVALQIPYKDTITSEHNAQRTFKMNENIFVLRSDSTVYYGVVKFDANKKHLEFYLDSNKSANNLVMAVDDFDFSRHLKLEYGDFAYIGITGSTGASVQTHEILSWEFCSDRDEVLSVENGFYESEELVQNENILKFGNSIITSVKINDQLGKVVYNEKVNQAELNLSSFNLANGMYYLTITDENGRSHYKKISVLK